MTKEKQWIHIAATVKSPVKRVWELWTNPADIIQWNNASPDWHTPTAVQDLKQGGAFSFRMEAKDGSGGFDFNGVYDVVNPFSNLEYTMEDGRRVRINFKEEGEETRIEESFEAEEINSPELQRFGWQSILDNFARYAEAPQRPAGSSKL